MDEAAAFAIKTPGKGAFGHVTKSGDLEVTDRALAGPVHPGQSAGQISQWPITNRRSILRAASTQENPRRRLAPQRQEPYGSAQLPAGYKAAANIVPAATLKLLPGRIEFAVELKRRPRRRATARLLHPLEFWRVLLIYATRAGSDTIDPASSRATAADDTTRIPADATLVFGAAGSRTA
jgi:hypothetical protein